MTPLRKAAFPAEPLRGLRPNWNVGMMEHWNNGFWELKEWVVGKIKLTKHKRNEKFGSNLFGRRHISTISPFHYSMCEARLQSLSEYL
jgi:hypothetical protein